MQHTDVSRMVRQTCRPCAMGCAALLLFAASVACTGCIPSNTITQVYYSQDEANEIDYDAPKILVNTPDAKQKSSDLPRLQTVQDAPMKDETIDELPEYGGDTSNMEVKEPEESTKDSERTAPREDSTKPGDKEAESASDVQGEKADSSEDADKRESGDGDESQDGDGTKSGSPDNDGEETSGDNADKDDGDEHFADVGDDEEIPVTQGKVAAVGNAAIIACMLGGADGDPDLVAADEALLANKMARKVLAARGIKGARAYWKGDGSSSGDLTDEKLEKLLELELGTCIVTDGDKTLSAEARKTLEDAGVQIVTVPELSSPERVKKAVEMIGELLDKAGDTKARDLSEEYVAFHDAVMGAYAPDTEFNTLYISNWETGVRYVGSSGKGLSAENGVAIAPGGSAVSAFDSYLEAAGVLNAAATKAKYKGASKSYVVWQFSGNIDKSDWKQGASSGVASATSWMKATSSGPAELSLVYANGCGLGSDDFPGVIVASKQAKKLMERDRTRDNGLYHPYPNQDNGAGTSLVGFLTKSGTILQSTIGLSSHGKPVLYDGSTLKKTYDIHVNPHGLFSSWAQGSVESVLETAWAYKEFQAPDGDDDGFFEDRTSTFYKTFYGYELGDEYDDIVEATYWDEG